MKSESESWKERRKQQSPIVGLRESQEKKYQHLNIEKQAKPKKAKGDEGGGPELRNTEKMGTGTPGTFFQKRKVRKPDMVTVERDEKAIQKPRG